MNTKPSSNTNIDNLDSIADNFYLVKTGSLWKIVYSKNISTIPDASLTCEQAQAYGVEALTNEVCN